MDSGVVKELLQEVQDIGVDLVATHALQFLEQELIAVK